MIIPTSDFLPFCCRDTVSSSSRTIHPIIFIVGQQHVTIVQTWQIMNQEGWLQARRERDRARRRRKTSEDREIMIYMKAGYKLGERVLV